MFTKCKDYLSSNVDQGFHFLSLLVCVCVYVFECKFVYKCVAKRWLGLGDPLYILKLSPRTTNNLLLETGAPSLTVHMKRNTFFAPKLKQVTQSRQHILLSFNIFCYFSSWLSQPRILHVSVTQKFDKPPND